MSSDYKLAGDVRQAIIHILESDELEMEQLKQINDLIITYKSYIHHTEHGETLFKELERLL